MDNNDILKQLESARQKYLPNNIKAIIIAEAAPDSIDRFFYYEDVRTADYLFLGIIGVLYPDVKRLYLVLLLDFKNRCFCSNGLYLFFGFYA